MGRAELTSAACFFLALLSYTRACSKDASWWAMSCWLVGTALLVACALLFKEQGITVVVGSLMQTQAFIPLIIMCKH